MRLTLAITGKLAEIAAAEQRFGEIATFDGIESVTRSATLELRSQTRAAGLGAKVANAWRDRAFPKTRRSLNAVGTIWSQAPKIHDGFSRGTPIRSAGGAFLAVPTENAPKRGVGGKRISPSNFPEHRFGPLRFVYRRGKPSLLVVDAVRVGKTGRVSGRVKSATTKSGSLRRGIATVVMFVLVPQVRLRKVFDLGATAERWGAKIPNEIAQRWQALSDAAAARD